MRRARVRIALVVDDDPRCRAMVARALSALGYAVLEARDGYQAIGLLCRRWRDLAFLIVDSQMPGVHGWEVIRFARMKAPRVRVLRLGCRGDSPPGPGYAGLEAVPALAKPFTEEQLEEVLRWRQPRPKARDAM